MEFGRGTLIGMSGSEQAALVTELCRALKANPCPALPSKRSGRVEFTMAILGRSLIRAKVGSKELIGRGFSGSEKGTWTVMKLFLGGEKNPPEVFLNLDPREGKGEFLMKDPAYGVAVMKKLVEVL
jgi:hypothetical protein